MTWHGGLTVSSAVTTVITFPRFFFFLSFLFSWFVNFSFSSFFKSYTNRACRYIMSVNFVK